MITFNDQDEKTHPAGPHRHWNESFYLNFFDPAGGWGGATRIGFSPNQGANEGFLLLFLPGGGVGFIRAAETAAAHPGETRVGPFVHQCIEPLQTWRFQYEGPIFHFEDGAAMGDFGRTMLHDLPRKNLKIDLEFTGLHEVFDFHQSMRKEFIPAGELLHKLRPSHFLNRLGPGLRTARMVRTMSGARHYEHAGRVKGVIEIDGERHDFEGLGQRDHSWGVRDMRVPANWRWFSGQLGEQLCFNAIKVEVLAFRASGGYVYHDGRAEALRSWSCQAEGDPSGKWARAMTLRLECASGRNFELKGQALANIPVIVNTGGYVQVVNEAMARFEGDGRTGLGVSEFMEQMI